MSAITPSDVVGAKIRLEAPNPSTSSKNTMQCPQGLCQAQIGVKLADVLEDHHRNFVAHKKAWEMERGGMLQRITKLEAQLRQYTSSKGWDALLFSDVRESDLARYEISPVSTQTSSPRECADGQARSTSGTQSITGVAAPNSSKAVADPLTSTIENMPPTSGKKFDASYQEAISTYQFSHSFRTLKLCDTAPSKTAASSLGSRSAQSPRSTAPSSFSQESPSTPVQNPVWLDGLPQVTQENMVKHAGHTPMARTGFGLDGTFNATGSDKPIPETQREQAVEPLPSAKPPSERSDSYFPQGPADDDPELQKPLSLANEDSGSREFMSQLQSKLEEAAVNSTPPAVVEASDRLDTQFTPGERDGN
ncbi:MAG: hypothetical protein Q9215_003912 [Flavoplaca cf. flavocitrina]